ncbi:MAG TPA: FGGY-family carbohydrate kinase [Magnetospirillaceae bacterium]|jgi:L-xylulokinase
MADYILGIDAGGTAVKAAVYSLKGEELGVTARPFRPITPTPGHAERDPEQLWTGLCDVIREAMSKAGVTGDDIAAVGITGYGNGLYLVDENGKMIGNGLLSSDQRAAPLVEEWRLTGQEDAYTKASFKRVWQGSPVPLLAWFKKHRPEVLKQARTLFTCKDYLRFRLTGARVAEVTDQSTATVLGTATRQVDPKLFAFFGVEDQTHLYPPLIDSFSVAGTITAEAAAATGLREGTPVPAGCSDNIAVMLGTGAINNGEMIIMAGTWGLHQVFLDYSMDDGNVGFICHALEPKRWIYCEGSPTSASSFEWFVDTFLRPAAQANPTASVYDLCNAAIARTDPEEPPVYFLPFLNGAFDDTRARCSLIGLSTWHHLGHAVRAVYEGVAFEHRRHHERLIRAFPKPSHAKFCGGAVRSKAWLEIFASALDLTLEVPKGEEFGARGAAMLAGVVIGKFASVADAAKVMTGLSHEVAPDPKLRAILDKRYPVYRELHAALTPHWHRGES